MVDQSTLIIITICIALFFDFMNGFHDAANAIATIVVTKVLTPQQAVLMAAVANFVGAFVFSVHVANTVGKGIVDPVSINIYIIIAALLGAIAWDVITWLLGIPTSSSPALIGGLIGSVLVSSGTKFIIFHNVLKIFAFIFFAPALGFIGASLFTVLILTLFRKSNPTSVNNIFGKLQLASAFFYSVGHGTNDAQKTMGVITVLLFTTGMIPVFHVPTWVILSAHAAIALGTYLGGWRIVKTMGTGITKLRPVEGFCAEGSGGMVLQLTALLGIPVSTTHVIAGSIMGVGAVENFKKVRWLTARKMVWAWILTIPLSGLMSAFFYAVIKIALT